MSNPIGGRARAVFTLGAVVVASVAGASAACTYDYQGALGGTTLGATSSGGAGSSSSGPTHASSSSAGGSGGFGGAGSAVASGGATPSSSTGGPVACADSAGQITLVTNDTGGGQAPWTRCGLGANLTANLQGDDLDVDCVALSKPGMSASNWLRVSFTFPGLPADASVTKIAVAIRRGATVDGVVEDRHAWIAPAQTFEVAMSTVAPWPMAPTWSDYTLEMSYAPGQITGTDFILQVTDDSSADVTAKVGYATATVSYTSNACP